MMVSIPRFVGKNLEFVRATECVGPSCTLARSANCLFVWVGYFVAPFSNAFAICSWSLIDYCSVCLITNHLVECWVNCLRGGNCCSLDENLLVVLKSNETAQWGRRRIGSNKSSCGSRNLRTNWYRLAISNTLLSLFLSSPFSGSEIFLPREVDFRAWCCVPVTFNPPHRRPCDCFLHESPFQNQRSSLCVACTDWWFDHRCSGMCVRASITLTN